MLQNDCHISTEYMFGTSHCAWYRLEMPDLYQLNLPSHLHDQVFQVSVCPVPDEKLHLMEFLVSEQFPKESFNHLVRCAKKLCGPRSFLNILHHGNLGSHLVVLSENASYHLDIDMSRLTSFDKSLLDTTKTPGPMRYNKTKAQMAQDDLSRVLFKKLRNFLGRTPQKPRQHRAWVDLLLKLIFLVFIQKKGWLNFDPFYCERMMEQCHRRSLSILHFFLKPLFARLNGTPGAEPLSLGTLPHLGGGLFKFSPEFLPAIENQLFLDLHEEVLSAYSFTLFEQKDGVFPMGITPEVLGTVFESLMIEEERKELGVFFTPSSVARRQVAASFQKHMEMHGHSLGSLKGIRILDPSCGSGTYLVAAFQFLLSARLKLVPEQERYNGRLFALKSEIVRNNLFGMDVNPLAVRLTEVRLWLNMIQDLEIGSPDQAPQLPHLQHHIRTGDFLAVPVHWNHEIPGKWPKYTRYLSLKKKFTISNDQTILLNHLVRLERELQVFYENHTLKNTQHVLKEAARQTILPGLDDGEPHYIKCKPKTKKKRTKSTRNADPLGPHLAFCGELLEGGFDLVIGNPPWLSAKEIPSDQKKRGLQLLSVFAGFQVKGQMDLSLYFTVLALAFTKNGGQLGFLLPGKLLQARYAERFRLYIRNLCDIDYFFDYGIDHGYLFHADTFPLAIGLTVQRTDRRKATPAEVQIERRGFELSENYQVPQSFFATDGSPWLIPPEGDLRAIAETTHWPKIHSFQHEIRRGIVTGNKRRFTFPKKHKDIPEDWLRPLIRGRDLQDQTVHPGAWILYPFDDKGAYLDDGSQAVGRYLGVQSGAEIASEFSFRPVIKHNKKYRLIWRYLDSRMRAWLIHSVDWIPDQTTYYMDFKDKEDALRLFFLFNSPIAELWSKNLAERGKDRYRFLYAQTMNQLRVPPDLMRKKPVHTWSGPILFPGQADSISWVLP